MQPPTIPPPPHPAGSLTHHQHRLEHIGQGAAPHAHHAARLLQPHRHQRFKHRMAHPAAGRQHGVRGRAAAASTAALLVDHQPRPLPSQHLLINRQALAAASCAAAAGGCRLPRGVCGAARVRCVRCQRALSPAASRAGGGGGCRVAVGQGGVGCRGGRGRRRKRAPRLGASHRLRREVAGVADGGHAAAQAQRPQHLGGSRGHADNLVAGVRAARAGGWRKVGGGRCEELSKWGWWVAGAAHAGRQRHAGSQPLHRRRCSAPPAPKPPPCPPVLPVVGRARHALQRVQGRQAGRADGAQRQRARAAWPPIAVGRQ